MRQVKQRRWIGLLTAIAACLLLVGATTVRFWSPPPTTSSDDPLAVEVWPMARGDLVRQVRVTGTVVPADAVNLTPKLAGRVAQFDVELGQSVSAGEIILRLESGEVEAASRQAFAALEAARANYNRLARGASTEEVDQAQAAVSQARAAYAAAEQGYLRSKLLFEEGAISRQQYESAQTQLEVSAAGLTMAERQLEAVQAGAPPEALAAAQASIAQAQAAFDLAQARVEDAVMITPIGGLVAHTGTVVGEMVAPGSLVAVIVALENVYIEAGLAESLVGQVEVGDRLAVRVRSAGEETRWGDVTQLSPAAHARTRLFTVRVRLPNVDQHLKPGMVAEIEIPTGRVHQQLLLPRRALITRGNASYVFVIVDDVAQRRRVQTGLYDAYWIEMVEGVDEGELVVVRGASYLDDGMAVNAQVVEEGP